MMKKLVKQLATVVRWNFYQTSKRGLFAIIVVLSMMASLMLSFPLNAQTPTSLPVRSPGTELRGVWLTNIDSDVLFEGNRLKSSLQKLKELNFNVVYPTVWNWGYTLYPSKVAASAIGRSLDPTPGLQGRDMLKEVVEEGHKQSLKVIPWFEFGFMAPADSQLAKRYPQWLTNRRNGTRIVKEGTHDRVWLSPFRPDVQKFIQDLIVEIVKNYDIDGIQFDDHFGLPSELGYDPYTIALYRKEHRGLAPSNNPKDPEWVSWRANKITNYMKQVFTAIKAVKKDCIVSVAPNPQRFSYEYFLADWEKWERMGLVEDLVLQIYRDDLKVFVKELEYPEVIAAKKHIPVSIGILSGLKGKTVPIQQIQTQVQKVRDRNFAGVAFFFYETLWNMSKEKPLDRQTGLQQIFPNSTTYPNLLAGWKP
ncbi:glycoside hydrolase family 10 protein [Calothrix anomala FACHB-343]|uniref:Glycoside hydrolase family 10 protein n=3 Tax=Calotrichaceae TaxID=2661849 RepID=A0ABR8ADM2_9CYAN|nr:MULTISPECIES: glycoside hydrolase family 10 protein [Calothrix]MBD2198046.1 glycoside hydrolase family 10 protein [Calothrix parietina FACHB-288]MBD2226321.1 glycoside hydrolase family 10 protein [Calothrix anomala FACHB-343]